MLDKEPLLLPLSVIGKKVHYFSFEGMDRSIAQSMIVIRYVVLISTVQ